MSNINKNEEELSFWKFLTFLSLMIAVFSSYLPEGKKFAIFGIFFLCILIYCLYKIYRDNKELILASHEGKLKPEILIGVIKIFDFLIIAILSYIISNLILNPDLETPLIITLLISSLIITIITHRKGFFELDNKLSLNLELFFSVFTIFCISLFFRFSYYLPEFWLYKFISLLGIFYASLGLFSLLLFIRIYFTVLFYKDKHKTLNIRQSLNKFRFKEYFSLIALFILLIFSLMFFIIYPRIMIEADFEKIIDNCTIKKHYVISDAHQLFNIYTYTIHDKEYTNISFVVGGIFKKDGEYIELDILKVYDKSYIQYFNLTIIRDLGFLTFRFYNKNIFYLDRIEIVVEEKVCNNQLN